MSREFFTPDPGFINVPNLLYESLPKIHSLAALRLAVYVCLQTTGEQRLGFVESWEKISDVNNCLLEDIKQAAVELSNLGLIKVFQFQQEPLIILNFGEGKDLIDAFDSGELDDWQVLDIALCVPEGGACA